jgi:hypothetical protein
MRCSTLQVQIVGDGKMSGNYRSRGCDGIAGSIVFTRHYLFPPPTMHHDTLSTVPWRVTKTSTRQLLVRQHMTTTTTLSTEGSEKDQRQWTRNKRRGRRTRRRGWQEREQGLEMQVCIYFFFFVSSRCVSRHFFFFYSTDNRLQIDKHGHAWSTYKHEDEGYYYHRSTQRRRNGLEMQTRLEPQVSFSFFFYILLY